MTDRLHLSATKEQQILIEQAEDRSERRGIARGIEMAIALHEAEGDHAAAQRLREARIVEAGNNG
jgi:hypothetical protein